jgi:type VI secretion system secreted protein VgrG
MPKMALNVTLTFPRTRVAGFDVEQLELRQGVSELFELTLQVLTKDPEVDMAAVVGEAIEAQLEDEALLPRVQGIVRRVRQMTSEPTGVSRYELIVVPPLWMTTRRRDHRIFRDSSVPEIVAAVLAGYGGRIPPPVSALSGSHPKREYTVQYAETDHDFVFRLLADEGIAAFFDHANRSAFTLVDDTTVFTPTVSSSIPFVAPSNQTPTTAHIQGVTVTSSVETSAIGLRDYDFQKPEFILQARAPAGKTGTAGGAGDDFFTNESNLEVYEFEVGNFSLQTEADARAEQLFQEARASSRVLSCASSFGLAAGTRFTLVGHPRADVDGDLLVVRARMVSRSQSSASLTKHTLECIPAATLFRPRRLPKPRIFGTQTAFVVGAPGEEIDVDEFGRVQIEFRWDRRDLHSAGTSRRVRVSQGWAGANFGFVMLPRVNEEVIVAYLDGDPDEPIIVGRVHNAFVTSPLKLPEQKTRSLWKSRSTPNSEGFNAILMEDLAGQELLALRAERDFRSDTGRNALTVVGVDATSRIGGSNNVSVKGAQSVSVGGSDTKDIGGPQKITADSFFHESRSFYTILGSDGTVWIDASERIDTSKVKHHIESPEIYLKGNSVIQAVAPTFHVFAGQEIHLQAGGSSIHITPGGIDIKSAGPVKINGSVVKLNC